MTIPAGGPVLITGALGAFGSLLAKSFTASEVSVLGVDNLHPSSEPLELKRLRLEELKKQGIADVHLMDVRSPEFASLIQASVQPFTLFHCAGWSTAATNSFDSASPRTSPDEISRLLVKLLAERADVHLVLLHHLAYGSSDNRWQDEHWSSLLHAEEELRKELDDRANVSFLRLPALAGPGQSTAAPPLLSLIQLISRIPVTAPEMDVTVAAVDPAMLAEDIVESFFEGVSSFELRLKPFAVPSISQLVEAFTELMNVQPTEGAARHHPAWGPPAHSALPTADVATFAARLIESLASLPQIPPADWPTVARKRPGKRSERKSS